MITRISKIKGFGNIIAGSDMAKIFKDGHVYEVTEVMGEIMIKDLGEHAISKSLEPFGHHRFSVIMMDGTYCLTKAEYETQLQKDKKRNR
jgi:hypothetical protein